MFGCCLCTGEDVLRADLPALITAEEVKSLEVGAIQLLVCVKIYVSPLVCSACKAMYACAQVGTVHI